MTLQERLDKMTDIRSRGYNCAQSVVLCFPDITGLDDETAAKLTSGLGTGVGGLGEICGAAAGIALVEGSTHGSLPADKIPAGKAVRSLCSAFADANGGRIACRDLKSKPDIRPCNELIRQAVEILHNRFAEKA